jgi:hypothetical protein
MLPLGEWGHNPEKFRAISRAQLLLQNKAVSCLGW